MAEFISVGPRSCLAVPEDIPLTSAVCLQVLATCVHAQRMIRPGSVSKAAVVGLGVSGLLHLQLLRLRMVEEIVVLTSSAWKRDLAYRFGATHVVVSEDPITEVDELWGGLGADLVIECVGLPKTYNLAFELAGPEATVLLFGVVNGAVSLQPYSWYYKELNILSPRSAVLGDFAEAIRLVQSGLVDTARLVTAEYSLDEVASALSAARSSSELKVTVKCS